MKKITIEMACSINGLIATEDGNEDFLSYRGWEIMLEFLKEYNVLIWGRKTWENVVSWGENYLNDLKGINIIILSETSKKQNHMTIEMVRLIFDYDKKAYQRMNQLIRYEVFKEFAKSNEKGIIFTGCFDFGKDFEKEKQETDRWMKLFEESYVIELEASLEERLKRNKTDNRLKHKASKRDLEWSENDLIKSISKHKLNSEPGEGEKIFKNYIKINNENLSAKEVATVIKERFDL